MNAYNAYRKYEMAIAVTALLVCLGASARAATYVWVSSEGGRWHENNWNRTGYPRSLWDFAVFNLDASYEVDATDGAHIPGTGLTVVNSGDVGLRAHDDLRTIVSVGSTIPARLSLRSGVIAGGGRHVVGPLGTIVLEPGSKLVSWASGDVGFEVEAGGTLRGHDAAVDNRTLRNSGTVSPGLAPEIAGRLVLGQDMPAGYIQRISGVLEIEIGGASPGVGHDQLAVASAMAPVMLDGTLVVSFINGYLPITDERYDILVAPAITGTFAAVELPSLPGVEVEVVYASDRVTVVASASGAPVIHALDIQPGGCPNPVNLGRRGMVPAALLGSDNLDVRDVDLSSLRIAGVAPQRSSFEDVGAPPVDQQPCACPGSIPDGRQDLTLKFSAPELSAAMEPLLDGGQGIVTLTGMLQSGETFEAADCVVVRGNNSRSKRPVSNFVQRSAPAEMLQRVTYTLSEAGMVRLEVFNIAGRRVADVVRAAQPIGDHSVEWNASSTPNGVYFYRIAASGVIETEKFMLLR